MTEEPDSFERRSRLSPAKQALFEKRLKDAVHVRTSMPGEEIQPFYFGASDKPLFGCYHEPSQGYRRGCGVVLCYPMGEEYIRLHRAYRQLALRLSIVGFPVLRFDFYGCGDSSGACEQGQVDQWLIDVSTALGEVRRRGHVTNVCLVGLRLGGALAMMVGAARGDVDGMVLWDPVVSGQAYVEELEALHHEMLRYAHVKPRTRIDRQEHTERLGFPLTDRLLTDLKNIDLLAVEQKPANRILVIESHEEAGQQSLREHLQRIDVHVAYQHTPNPELWTWIENFGKVRVPHQILQSVISWISEVYP